METKVEIGGRVWRIVYTVNSMCQMEEIAGGPIAAALTGEYRAARLLFWGAVTELQPETTLKQAGQAVDEYIKGGGSLAGLIDICGRALKAAGFVADDAG